MPVSKAQILDEIRKLSSEAGGVVPGQRSFESATGIGRGEWRGKFWATWNEAVAEAGPAPNPVSKAHERIQVLDVLAVLTRKLGRFPTSTDLRMEKRIDETIPGTDAIYRLGSHSERIEMVRAHVSSKVELTDVLALLPARADVESSDDGAGAHVDGAVYMLKLGKHYKIGKTFSVPRRHREIALELPEKPDIVHVIATDDPSGIEAYWHGRFASKRTNGEWFALTREDLRAFKRRKFM